jgi:hypothetical protein
MSRSSLAFRCAVAAVSSILAAGAAFAQSAPPAASAAQPAPLPSPLPPVPSPPEAEPDGKPLVHDGVASDPKPLGTAFRVDLKLPAANLLVVTSVENKLELSSTFALVPQLFLGVRAPGTGRLGLLLGLGFDRVSLSQPLLCPTALSCQITPSPPPVIYASTQTLLLVAPTLTFDLFQLRQRTVAFYALGGPVFGTLLATDTAPGSGVIGYQLAIGGRLSLHENFAVGLEAGQTGDVLLSVQLAEGAASLGLVGMYCALTGTFVYPR